MKIFRCFQNLENQNKQLNTDNAVLRTRIQKTLEFNRDIQCRNKDLHTEIIGLKKVKCPSTIL